MSKLFVIGNGFDIAHKFKTKYNHFRDYLINNFDGIQVDYPVLPEAIYMPDGEIEYNDEEVLSMLLFLLDEVEFRDNKSEWNNIEYSLGQLEYDTFLDDNYYDEDNLIHMAYNNEDTAQSLITPVTSIQKYFQEWINQIEINSENKNSKFEDLIEENDQFLTFNYTSTLEEVYDVDDDNICYIHGRQGEEIHFGHGSDRDDSEYYSINYIGSDYGLSTIHENLRKRTDLVLQHNKDFFENLKENDITSIYSYGFSFGEVDTIYLKEICKNIDTSKVTWYLNNYDSEEDRNNFKNVIISSGFKGKICLYEV